MSLLEETLVYQLLHADLPPAEREYKFHPTRKWRWDFAWPADKVAVECQGGTWTKGAHSSGSGLERDYEKINAGQLMGWRVFQASRKMIESGEVIDILKIVLRKGA